MGLIDDSVKGIIQILKNKIPEGGDVARYFYGEPNVPPLKYPVVFVQFANRTYFGKADSSRFLYTFNFDIGILTRSMKEDEAEVVNYNLIEKIETTLRAQPSLNGLMIDSELSPSDIVTSRASIEDYAMTKAVMTMPYRQWVNA